MLLYENILPASSSSPYPLSFLLCKLTLPTNKSKPSLAIIVTIFLWKSKLYSFRFLCMYKSENLNFNLCHTQSIASKCGFKAGY